MNSTWKIITVIIFILMYCCPKNIKAQTNDFSLWSSIFIKKKIGEKYSLLGEAHNRRNGIALKRAQELYVVSAAYKINPLFSTRLGLQLFRTKKYPDNGADLVIGEVSIFEDLVVKKKKNALTYSFRLRFEQRWVQQKTFAPDMESYELAGNIYKNRIRAKVALKVDFGKDKEFFTVIYDELWLNQNDYLLPKSFDQNWAGFVFGYKATSFLTARIGYQYRLAKPATKIASFHILQPSVVISF